MNKRIIPITKLRYFYKSLAELSLSTETQLNIVKDINRKENYEKLISWYIESKKDFAEYSNIDESFLPDDLSKRKELPDNVITIKNTQDVISVLKNDNYKFNEDYSDYNFKYIEREVPTHRITNTKSPKGKKSGSGGIDFIGYNRKDFLPILGEVKVRSDQNSFYALIQLLTYLSELSTENQIERIDRHNLFKNEISLKEKKNIFYLYILFVHSSRKGPKLKMLEETIKLAARLEEEIPEINKIVFLNMDEETKIITKA